MTWEYILAWVFRLLFFYFLWRIMNRLSQIMSNGQAAAARAQRLEDLRAEDLIELKKSSDEILHRQECLDTKVAAKAELAASVVADNLGRIEDKIAENTNLTIAAAQASANAAEIANHMNEKIAKTHNDMVNTLREVVSQPAVTASAEMSLKQIDANTAAIQKDTARVVVDIQDLKGKA